MACFLSLPGPSIQELIHEALRTQNMMCLIGHSMLGFIDSILSESHEGRISLFFGRSSRNRRGWCSSACGLLRYRLGLEKLR